MNDASRSSRFHHRDPGARVAGSAAGEAAPADGRPRLRVAIRSPHEVVARGLRSMLAAHPTRAQVVEVGEGPDVVLYDVIDLDEGTGLDLDGWVAAGVTVLAVARERCPDLLTEALARGAHGSVALDLDADALVRIVADAPDHRPAPPAAASRTPSRVPADRYPRGHVVDLSPREREVLGLIARGHSNQEIAEQIFLSINSVKTHIRAAYRKIGVASRSQAVIWCFKNGFPTASSHPAEPPARPVTPRNPSPSPLRPRGTERGEWLA